MISDLGMKEINIYFLPVDGNLLTQQKVMINTQYQIKTGKKIKFNER